MFMHFFFSAGNKSQHIRVSKGEVGKTLGHRTDYSFFPPLKAFALHLKFVSAR